MKNKRIQDDYYINLSKFLFVYYNIESKDIYKLTHRQVKEMFDIGSLPNEIINRNDILTGKTVLVKDIEGNVLGYNNPLLKKQEFDGVVTSPEISFNDDNIDLCINDINSYSSYELEEMIKKCKKCHKDKTKNIIIKELHRRNNLHEETKEKRLEKVRIRELRKE